MFCTRCVHLASRIGRNAKGRVPEECSRPIPSDQRESSHLVHPRVMSVLLEHNLPFLPAHGGRQIQIEQTKAALERIDVDVAYPRWWDGAQPCDVLHYFSRVPVGHIRFAQAKGIKPVRAKLLTGQGSRPRWRHHLHRIIVRGCEAVRRRASWTISTGSLASSPTRVSHCAPATWATDRGSCYP